MSNLKILTSDKMNDIIQKVLGSTYFYCSNNLDGCYVSHLENSRRKVWLCPKLIIDTVSLALAEFNISLEPPVYEEVYE